MLLMFLIFNSFVLTSSKSYWHESVAAFPIITASGTNILSSFKLSTEKSKRNKNNILITELCE